MTTRRSAVLLFACSALAFPFNANAQLDQQKSVTIIVPYAPGGPLDNAARLLAEKVRPLLGVNVIVENKPGAGGNIGATSVARAAPDGHTLLMGAVATHAINPWLYEKMPYDALNDFTPITLVARVPNVLIMNGATAKRLQISSVQELISYAKKNPGKLNFASGGNGSAGHLAGELFKTRSGVEMLHVPFGGAAPAQTALISGTCDLMFDNLAAATANIKGGKFIALGMTTIERSTSFPEVPTISETLPGFQVNTWFGIFAPAKLAENTANQIHKAFVSALSSEDIVEKFARMSAVPSPMTRSSFTAMVRQENAAYGQLIKVSKITLE
jgi:tripartite-type tricarboxylate transporter receptor subunit TctC